MSSSAHFNQMKILVVGGSQNIGYHSALRLLQQGHIVTYLLRSPQKFDTDEKVQPYVKSGQARLVKGDSMVDIDARRAWEKAGKGGAQEGYVDFVISTVGGGSFSLTKGVYLDPPDLCTRALRTLLSAMPAHLREPGSQPRIVAVSSTGISKEGHAALPTIHKLTYPTLLAAPHRDKLGLELVLAHVSGHTGDWVPASEHAEPQILPAGWEHSRGLPRAGELPNAVLIRAAWLTDGPAKEQYRTVEGQGDKKCKTMGREDVAHFIAERLVHNWDQWKGKAVTLAY